jgi:hypothetical protein
MKFRKKPVVIDAFQTTKRLVIHTLEGDMTAQKGDWIVTGVKGEKYPVKPDIFASTYEPAEVLPKSPVKNENPLKKGRYMWAVMELLSEFSVGGGCCVQLPEEISGFIIVYRTKAEATKNRQSNTAEIMSVQFSKTSKEIKSPPYRVKEGATMVCAGLPVCKRGDCFHSKQHPVRYDCSTFNAKCPRCVPQASK